MDGDGFDIRVQPVTFAELRQRLKALDIIEDGTPSHGTRVLRQFRMGVGTDQFFSIAYRGEKHMVTPPTIENLLDRFGLTAADWAAASNFGGVRESG